MKLKEKPYYLLGGNATGIPFTAYSLDHEFTAGTGMKLYACINDETSDSYPTFLRLECTENMEKPFESHEYRDLMKKGNPNAILACYTKDIQEANKIRDIIATYNSKNRIDTIV